MKIIPYSDFFWSHYIYKKNISHVSALEWEGLSGKAPQCRSQRWVKYQASTRPLTSNLDIQKQCLALNTASRTVYRETTLFIISVIIYAVCYKKFFNNSLFLTFIILQKYWDRTYISNKITYYVSVIGAVYNYCICLSDIMFRPLWRKF